MEYSKMRVTWWTGTVYHKEQLDLLINSTDVKTYAYILHDKDIDQKTKEPKKPHYHFLVQLLTSQRGSWFKQFASDDMGIIFPQPCYAPQGAYDYLIHDTAAAKKDGKYLYPETERISTIEQLDSAEKELDENDELYADLMDLLDKKISWHEMLKRKPKRIHMISNIKSAYDILKNERYGIGEYEDIKNIEIPEQVQGKAVLKAIQTEMSLGLIRVDPKKTPF